MRIVYSSVSPRAVYWGSCEIANSRIGGGALASIAVARGADLANSPVGGLPHGGLCVLPNV